jgi:MFS family permease
VSEQASTPVHAPAAKHAAPWLFAFTAVPYGIVGSFSGTTMPFLARKAGIDMESIGWFGFATMIPPMLQFLYAPVVDFGPKRKHWLVIVSAASALCIALAMAMPLPQRTGTFMALAVAGQLISGLVGSCNGGIVAASMPDSLRGKTAGYLNTGNLAGGAFGTAAALWMNGRFSPKLVGLAMIAMMVLPALVALAIPEPPRPPEPIGRVFGDTMRDLWAVLRTRAGWSGVLLCASPVGTAALMNYFSALAEDFHAPDRVVLFVNGWASGLVTAFGSLLGGWLCDRMNRRAAYLGSAALTAVVGLAMRQAPMTATTYTVGVLTYLFVTGLCFAAFSAFVFEVVGGSVGKAAATQYTLFTAAGNFAIAYVGKIDTHYHERFGVRGVLAADAALNVLGIAVLGALFLLLLRKPKTAPVAESEAA